MLIQKVVSLVLVENHCIFAAQRKPEQTLPMKWHLPGGKVNSNESLEHALIREMKEEFGFSPIIKQEIANVQAKYKHGIYDVHFIRASRSIADPVIANQGCNFGFAFIRLKSLDNYDWLEYDLNVAKLALIEANSL